MFIEQMAERVYRYPEEIGGFCLIATHSLECLFHVLFLERIEDVRQVQAFGGKLFADGSRG